MSEIIAFAAGVIAAVAILIAPRFLNDCTQVRATADEATSSGGEFGYPPSTADLLEWLASFEGPDSSAAEDGDAAGPVAAK